MKPAKPKIRGRARRIFRAAYHEAGHAVVAMQLQHARKPLSVTIVFDHEAGHLGMMDTRPLFRKQPRRITRLMRKKLAAEIIVFLAGSEAEKIAIGRYDHRGASWDRETAAAMAIAVLGTDRAVVLEYLTRARHAAETFVQAYWSDVQIVARALIEKETLTRKDLEMLLKTGRTVGIKTRSKG